jgi:hypothetical protein
MPLKKIPLKAGFNKQDTSTAAEGQWIDGDFVRFRYGYPEKIGGWQQTTSSRLAGSAREILTWTALDGNRYSAIGTNKLLVIYSEGVFYDITPLGTALTSCNLTSTTGSATVTVTKVAHGLSVGDYIVFTSPSLAGGGVTTFSDSNFTTNPFEIISTPNSNSFTVTMPVVEAGTGMSGGGSTITTTPYVDIGPPFQISGFGFGTGVYGGLTPGSLQNQLNGAINNSTGTITVDSTTGFPASGTILIDSELITYASKSGTQFLTCGRGASGTTAVSHLDNATVFDTSTFVGWGQAATVGVTLSPGLWSLDNFGQILIATIRNGKTFSWNPGASTPLLNRATVLSGAPTSSVMSIVSDRDRHLFLLGTETSIGNLLTQDPMFIRFSNQEDFNTYNPTATNTAGTFRLDTGNFIVGAIQGKDYIFVLTDLAAYVIQFVGPPFVFSVRQVGTNCGCISQNSIVYAQGAVFWMGSGGGFFVYDGTVKQLPSLVEDFVFTTGGDNLGINYSNSDIIYGSHNNLYNEVIWFYPSDNSIQNDRSVVYNYLENTWTTMSLARTSWADAEVFDKPYAIKYDQTMLPTFPTINGITNANGASIYYEHETGVNDVDISGTKTAIPAYIESGDFELDVEGDGQYLMKINRFIPDFKILTGNAKVTLLLRDYPSQTQNSQMLGPYTVTSSTTKIDTRARNRLMSIKVENESTDENWRYGLFRVDIQPDGRR